MKQIIFLMCGVTGEGGGVVEFCDRVTRVCVCVGGGGVVKKWSNLRDVIFELPLM